MADGKTIGLEALEHRIAWEQSALNQPVANWVPSISGPGGAPMLDVLIVGGGMCGVAAATHLRRLGIHNIRIIEAQPAGLSGPWRTFARMETLRSPKHLTGPAAGQASLTFRAWYTAQHGEDAWQALGLIPREIWADYLGWFAHITGANVEHCVQLENLEPVEVSPASAWRATVHHTGAGSGEKSTREHLYARMVVLATGREALASPRIPSLFAPYRGDGVDHTGDAPQRTSMRGRDVAVIGLGASAFDYAAEALEAGAHHVRIVGRSEALSRINKAKQIVYAGFVHGYPQLDDAAKAATLEYIFARGIAPPRGTVQRVMRHPNVEIVLGAPATNLTRNTEGRFHLVTPRGSFEADRIILGTGYRVDLDAASFLRLTAPAIRRWRDVLPASDTAGELLDFPYLGQGFQFEPRTDAAPAALANLLCFNHAAMLSLGNLANDIPAVSEGADRLARYVAAKLFLHDHKRHMGNLQQFEDSELLGDEVPGLESWWPELK